LILAHGQLANGWVKQMNDFQPKKTDTAAKVLIAIVAVIVFAVAVEVGLGIKILSPIADAISDILNNINIPT